MNWINDSSKERELLKNISMEIARNSDFSSFEDELKDSGESYYQSSSQSLALSPYSFETIVELRSELEKLWEDNETMKKFIPVVLASAFKQRKSAGTINEPIIEHKDGSGDELLPVYTYTL